MGSTPAICILLWCRLVHILDAAFVSDWGTVRSSQPVCVDIPHNMSLCHGIGYNKMRMPNLLEHDSMAEVSQQAASWVPLLNVQCHSDTQLFLCSLFSPVCLDRPIYPCRSLCQAVQSGCESRMKAYGFPWPDMFRCDRFPIDNDMCIRAQSTATETSVENDCSSCNQVETYENILDNFCRADFAVRTRIRRARNLKIWCKKSRILKTSFEKKEDMRSLRHPTFSLHPSDSCCETQLGKGMYLIMGHHNKAEGILTPSFIMPWSRNSKVFKKAVRMFKRLNCSDPNMVSHSMIPVPTVPTKQIERARRGQQQRQSKMSDKP